MEKCGWRLLSQSGDTQVRALWSGMPSWFPLTNTHPLRDSKYIRLSSHRQVVRCHILPQQETSSSDWTLAVFRHDQMENFVVSSTCLTAVAISHVLEIRLFLLSRTAFGTCCGYVVTLIFFLSCSILCWLFYKHPPFVGTHSLFFSEKSCSCEYRQIVHVSVYIHMHYEVCWSVRTLNGSDRVNRV